MKSFKYLISESKNLEEIKGFIEVYEELAASNMQKVRKLILSAREFFENLEKLSAEVGSDVNSIIKSGKKIAAVFVSSNGGLYGEIIDRTFQFFLEFVKKNEAEVYVVGRLGATLMKTLAPGIPFQVFECSDDTILRGDFDLILRRLFPYSRIVVFYGKFYNIAVQHPYVSDISGEFLSKSPDTQDLSKIRFRYLYEPSLFRVSEFFAGEILSSSLEQILRESQLAKHASRLMQLDQTLEVINTNLDKLKNQKRQLGKKISGKKQNSMISGIIARR